MAIESGVRIRTLMAPEDDTMQAFLDYLSAAKESIYTNIYGFHAPKISDLLIAKHQAGVEVSLILDHTQAAGRAEAGEVVKLRQAGIPMLIGTSEKHRQILHLKATVVDRRVTAHGSWNYSLSASDQLNDLHFVDDPAFAQFYLRHHDRIRFFILMHEMALQPTGEIPAPAAFPNETEAQIDAETSPETSPDPVPVSVA